QDWDTWLPALLYVMRTSVRRDHGYSAFFLTYGREPRGLDQDEIQMIDEEDETKIEEIMIRVKQISELNDAIIPRALNNIIKYKENMIKQYNKRTKEEHFQVND
ncbi:hypothetical protein BD560DRAFT_342511, partial [Blakeslea trispora]